MLVIKYIFCISKDIRSKKEKKRPHWVHIGLFKLLSQPPRVILGEPGVVSRVDKMFVVKVYCKFNILSTG